MPCGLPAGETFTQAKASIERFRTFVGEKVGNDPPLLEGSAMALCQFLALSMRRKGWVPRIILTLSVSYVYLEKFLASRLWILKPRRWLKLRRRLSRQSASGYLEDLEA